jgi:prepilin signal peptidase PulO-like enzyme (type II secretory pathway)
MFVSSIAMKEETLGGGDVKLMFFVGSVLNVISPIELLNLGSYAVLINGFVELFLCSCLASPFALFNFFSKKERVVPFGPFILLACFILFITSFNFLSLLEI